MKQSTICILTGPKGSGKTYTAREIISLHPRILALDPHGSEFSLPGAVAVSDDDELLVALKANWKTTSWLLTYTPAFDIEMASESIASRAFERRNCLAVFDECGTYMHAGRIGRQMQRLIMQSRHRSVNVVLASPRLADVATDVRTQADAWVICGALWTARDVDTLEEHTSTEFRRTAQEPLQLGEHRQLGFDTQTRQPFEITRANLQRLFDPPRVGPRPVESLPAEPRGFWRRLLEPDGGWHY
jgi:hypothetical protein